jgi:hypothetical protein
MLGWFSIHKSLYVVQHTSISKNKNHIIIPIDAEKVFDKIQLPFVIKAIMKLEIEEIYLNIIKSINDKSTANIWVETETISSKVRNESVRYFHSYSTYSWNA